MLRVISHRGEGMGTMKGQSRPFARSWMLSLAIVVLIAGHGIGYYSFRHMALPTAVVAGVILLAVITHLGIRRSVSRRSLRPGIQNSNKPKAG
jgi:hypothetical protein